MPIVQGVCHVLCFHGGAYVIGSAGGWVKCNQWLHLRQMLLMHHYGMELLPSFWITKSVISFNTNVTYVKIILAILGYLEKKLEWYSFSNVQPRAWIAKERLIKDILQWIKGKSRKTASEKLILGSNAPYVLSYISDTTNIKSSANHFCPLCSRITWCWFHCHLFLHHCWKLNPSM